MAIHTGPREAIAAYVETNLGIGNNGVLKVIDGRGNIWIFDPSVNTDIDGNPIVMPPRFDDVKVLVGRDRMLVVEGGLGADQAWLYNFTTQTWHPGPSFSDQQPEQDPYSPWKLGHNVTTEIT